MSNPISCPARSKSSAVGAASIGRRRFLTAAPAALGVTMLGGTVRGLAATTPHAFRHGVFEITIVSDGYFVLPPPNVAADVGFLYPDIPRPELAAFLKSVGLSIDRVQLPNNIVLVRTDSDLILVDTGAGSGWQPTLGKLIDNLQAAGIDRGKITKVVFNHEPLLHLWGTSVGH